MAKADDTRDANASASEAQERRIVRTEDGELAAFIAMSLEEAETQAKAEAQAKEAEALAKEAAAAQAKAEAAKKEAQYLKAKQRRMFPTKKDPNAPPPKERAMKVERFLTVVDLRTPKDTPALRVSGKWLAQAGFPPETRVKITVAKGCLVITKERAAA